jgi:glycosyltransferase involved in cell wall biosynthesis
LRKPTFTPCNERIVRVNLVVAVALTGTAIIGLAFSRTVRAEFWLTLIVLLAAWVGILVFVLAACLWFYLRIRRHMSVAVSRESKRVRLEVAANATKLKADANSAIAEALRRSRNESRRLVASAEQRVSAGLVEMIDRRERELVARFDGIHGESVSRLESESRRLVASAEQRVSAALVELSDGRERELVSRLDDDLSVAAKRLRNEYKRQIASVSAGIYADVEKYKAKVDDLQALLDTQLSTQHESNLHRVFLMAQHLGSCENIFTREELRILSNKFSDYDDLEVYWLLSTYNAFDILPLSQRRKLATNLRNIGYLAKSLEVFRSVVALTNKERDHNALAYRKGELKVYSGGYKTELVPNSESLDGIPGHVLHVVGRSMPSTQSGYTLRTHYTAIAQRQAGLQVSVVSQMGEVDMASQELDVIDDIAYYTLPGKAKNTVPWDEWLTANIRQLQSLVSEIRPSVLHAHSDFFNAISAQAVGDYFGIPVVYESRGFWEESWLSRTEQRFKVDWVDLETRWGLPEAYVLRKAREEEARSHADRVFTLARVMKERIVEAGVAASKIALVPNSVSSHDFPVLGRDLELARTFEVADECITVGYVSSIVEYEGIDTLLEGFRLAQQQVECEMRLLIVGDGPVLPALKEQAERSEIDNVHFVGKVAHEDILRYYSLIDIFVVPRRPAAVCHLVTPLKPFEAFSTGRTVVMSDVLALREIAEDSGAAELFTAGDPDSLAAVLCNLLNNPGRRMALAERGAAWVRAQRSWSRNAAEYLSVYRDMGVAGNK